MENEDPYEIIYALQSENIQLAAQLQQAEIDIAYLKSSRDEFKSALEKMLLSAKTPSRNPQTVQKWKFYHEYKAMIKHEQPELSWHEIKKITDQIYEDTKSDASSEHLAECEGASESPQDVPQAQPLQLS
jgi:hypothetical protein